jgi:hypothetical protein
MVAPGQAEKKLFLHIGLGKTGTSALQSFFAQNHERLSSQGIWYPQTGREGLEAHHRIATAARPGGGTGFDTTISWAAYIEQLRAELAQRTEPTVLLSSEVFSGRMTWRLLHDLKQLFSEIQVVAYLRRQDILIASNYNQWVKTENLRLGLDDLRMLPFDFEAMLEPWKKLLAGHPGGVLVRPYERSRLWCGSIVDDFMYEVLGLEIDESYHRPLGHGGNLRLSLRALEYKRRVNTICPREIAARFVEPLVEYSRHALEDQPEAEAEILTPGQRREILAAFAQSNASVARRYLGRDDGELFSDLLVPTQDGQGQQPGVLDYRQARDISQYVAAWSLGGPDERGDPLGPSERVRTLLREVAWPASVLAPFFPDRAVTLLIRRLAVALHGPFSPPTDEDVVGMRWAKP